MKFKVGDKVRLVKSVLHEPADIPFGLTRDNPIGKIGVIETVFDLIGDKTPFHVNFKEDGGNDDWCYGSEELELVVEEKSTGTKNDSGKSRISLIPTDALVGMGNALKYGEQKYGTHNYRNGLAFSRLVDACLRHLSSWNEGENNDPESGLSHLDHALASLAMLKFMDVNRQDMDDRWLNPIHGDPEVDQKSLYEQAKEIQKRGR